MGSELDAIEPAFRQLMLAHGFKRGMRRDGTPPDYVDGIQFVRGRQKVSISYAQTREQWCEVTLGGYEQPEPVTDLLVFVRYATGQDVRYVSTNDLAELASEAKRCSEFLSHYCAQFLSGNITEFRRTYRELFLLSFIRNARSNADAAKDWKEFARFHEWLTDYWTEADLEEAKHARQRGWCG